LEEDSSRLRVRNPANRIPSTAAMTTTARAVSEEKELFARQAISRQRKMI
jgi:hypothetical protein